MRILGSLFPFTPFLNADGGGSGGTGGATAGAGNGGTGAGDSGAGGSTGGTGAQLNPQSATQPQPQGKVFTAEYVQALRDEAAGYRTRAKALEAAIRGALGLAEGADLPQDLNAALAGLRTAAQQAAAEELNTAKGLYAQGLFAAAGAGKLVDTDAAYALVAQAGFTVEVDLKAKTLVVKDAEGKQLADKDGKALTGKAAMAALVDKLIERYPFLKGQSAAGPGQVGGTAPAGGGAGQTDEKAWAKQFAEERAKARGNTGGSSFWGRKKQ